MKEKYGKYWHDVCIVGGDDTYPKSNFKIQTPNMGDGAFIIKNSWGTSKGNKGYYYVSYHDTSLACYNRTLGISGGFSFTSVQDNTNYGRNYHYTPLGVTSWLETGQKNFKYRSQWTANCDETLKACGIYVNDASDCIIDVYMDDIIISTTHTSLNHAGFHTILLKTPVISNGETFMIQVTQNSYNKNISLAMELPTLDYSKATANMGESYIYYNGWTDTVSIWNNANICINAYTEYTPLLSTKITASDLTVTYGEHKYITATLSDLNNVKIRNAKLIFNINGVNQVVTTNNNGQGSILTNKDIGTYSVNINYYGNEKYDYTTKAIKLIIKPPKPKNININLKESEVGKALKFSLKSSD